jgi:hypothetical protein
VRVVEHSVLWKEKEASKVFTYQGLTTCTEDDRSWTITSSAYNHVRSKRGEDERSMAMFIRKEVGYRSPKWRVLRALQSLLSATQLQGESAVDAPPFFPNASRSGETSKDQLSSCGMAWMKRGGRNATCNSDTKRLGCVEPSATNEGGLHTKKV